jgi:hypothetical protein
MWLVRSPLKSQELFGDGPRQVGACVNQSQKLLDDGQTGSYSGPEVRFWEVLTPKPCRDRAAFFNTDS